MVVADRRPFRALADHDEPESPVDPVQPEGVQAHGVQNLLS